MSFTRSCFSGTTRGCCSPGGWFAHVQSSASSHLPPSALTAAALSGDGFTERLICCSCNCPSPSCTFRKEREGRKNATKHEGMATPISYFPHLNLASLVLCYPGRAEPFIGGARSLGSGVRGVRGSASLGWAAVGPALPLPLAEPSLCPAPLGTASGASALPGTAGTAGERRAWGYELGGEPRRGAVRSKSEGSVRPGSARDGGRPRLGSSRAPRAGVGRDGDGGADRRGGTPGAAPPPAGTGTECEVLPPPPPSPLTLT